MSKANKAERKFDPVSSRKRGLTQIERLCTSFDYTEKFSSTNLSQLFLGYGVMDSKELAYNLKRADLTYIEKSIIYIIMQMKPSSKNSVDAIKYFHERAVGKILQGIEHSGNPERPIHIKSEEQELEDYLKNLSPEELKQFEAIILQTGTTLGTTGQEDTSS